MTDIGILVVLNCSLTFLHHVLNRWQVFGWLPLLPCLSASISHSSSTSQWRLVLIVLHHRCFSRPRLLLSSTLIPYPLRMSSPFSWWQTWPSHFSLLVTFLIGMILTSHVISSYEIFKSMERNFYEIEFFATYLQRVCNTRKFSLHDIFWYQIKSITLFPHVIFLAFDMSFLKTFYVRMLLCNIQTIFNFFGSEARVLC